MSSPLMTEETGRVLLAPIFSMAAVQEQILTGQTELVSLARPTLAGHWGNATMALATIGVAVSTVGTVVTVLTWRSVTPKDVADFVVRPFETVGKVSFWCCRRIRRGEGREARAVPAPGSTAAADLDLERGDQLRGDLVVDPPADGGKPIGGVGQSGRGALRRRNQRSSEGEDGEEEGL